MNELKAKNKHLNIAVYFIIFAVVIGGIAALFYFMNGKIEYISLGGSEISIGSLSCAIEDLNESSFNISGATHNTQNIKVTFSDNNVGAIMYTLEVDYVDYRTAKTKEAGFHAYYDTYMSDNELDIEAVSNDFSLVDNKVRIKLYAEKKDLNLAIDKLFMLNPNISYSGVALKKYYEDKGFICNYKD